jgi:serine phosphatase RsbU (regulator of sigma subunit)
LWPAGSNSNILISLENQLIVNTAIAESIRYAARIQAAILPEISYFLKILKDSFILYIPRDIVSGDFYYINQKKHRIVVAAADCTGHGVPGAFMSIMGINFLNQITANTIPSSNIILNQLREYVMKSLHQCGHEDDQKDGMDIALTVIDLKTRILEFSGANNPLVYFKKKNLFQIKSDRMPIGISPVEEESFKRFEIPLSQVDKIYLFSDGYIDQFGVMSLKKLKSVGFYTILRDIQEYPFSEHKNLLSERLSLWKGNLEQIDDILIIGINLQNLTYET